MPKLNDEFVLAVATPFYNEERYLSQCIESVLSQSLGNFAYFLFDNCSTDKSRDIAQSYASKDSRIRLIVNESHLSAEENMNRAFAVINTQFRYIKFVFGDDWLFPSCLTEMVRTMEDNPSVSTASAFTLIETRVFLDCPDISEKVLTGPTAARRFLLEGKQMFGSPTCSIYRTSMVQPFLPAFSSARPCDDVSFVLRTLDQHDFAFIHQVLSFTRRQPSSTSTRMNRLGLFETTLPIALAVFGRRHLSDTELRQRSRAVNLAYGRKLSALLYSRSPTKILAAHRQEFQTANVRFPTLQVVQGIILGLAEKLLNVWNLGHTIYSKLSKRYR